MSKPQISWYILEEDDTENPTDDYYAGNYDWEDTVDLDIRIWNNRWGDEDVNNARDIVLELKFFYNEQNKLLKNIEIEEEGQKLEVQVLENIAKTKIKKTLSGRKHSLNEYENEDNYVDINIKIPIEENTRPEVKNMILTLDYERSEA